MLGLGETDEEILQVMRVCKEHNVDMLDDQAVSAAVGASFACSGRYVHPDTFKMFESVRLMMGLSHAAVGDGAVFVSCG